MGIEQSHARVLIAPHWSRRQGAAVTSYLWSRASRQQCENAVPAREHDFK